MGGAAVSGGTLKLIRHSQIYRTASARLPMGLPKGSESKNSDIIKKITQRVNGITEIGIEEGI